MTQIYREADADPTFLHNRLVAVIGYGKMGRPMALNLRDSGVNVIVGTRAGENFQTAQADQMTVMPIPEAIQQTDIVLLTIPDEAMPEVYLEQVAPHLQKGDALIFASAYNIAFGFIEAPPFVDVGLIAPRTIGEAVRERYLAGKGFYSFISVGQDASGHTWEIVLALAHAVGSLRAGAIEMNFEREAELDLFIEQAVLPAFQHVMLTAAQLLIDQGYPPEAVFTDLYLSGEFTDYLARAGKHGLLDAITFTAPHTQYGMLSRQDRFDDLKMQRLMEVTLDQIKDGSFAREWAKEYANGYPRLGKLYKERRRNELWDLEKQVIEDLNQTPNSDLL
ncbi:MAG: ketol-acid reductoisomerase [Phototrophicaceae bacterium]|jgi:ketol-acid reductoisomerase